MFKSDPIITDQYFFSVREGNEKSSVSKIKDEQYLFYVANYFHYGKANSKPFCYFPLSVSLLGVA